MASPGVYWMPLFETLEARGLQGCLISAQSLKHVPGRKSDVLDCQWIQTLHSYGLLSASFRPEADCVALRTLLRHRAQLLEHRAPHILHMQKALLQMNIQLSQALSAVTGVTGQCIIRAIVAGERDPRRLAALRNYRCTKDIIGDSVYLLYANLSDLTRQTTRVPGRDRTDARRVCACAAGLCCGLCPPLSARQDLGRQGAPTPGRRRRQRRLAADGRQAVLHPRLPEDQSAANHARLAI